jgi:hypothetical protein
MLSGKIKNVISDNVLNIRPISLRHAYRQFPCKLEQQAGRLNACLTRHCIITAVFYRELFILEWIELGFLSG